ncbi:hypothetical protein BVX95_01595 [archaeon D22]|nr:hypothetical protein BVX95_01595 [archaeon D22]
MSLYERVQKAPGRFAKATLIGLAALAINYSMPAKAQADEFVGRVVSPQGVGFYSDHLSVLLNPEDGNDPVLAYCHKNNLKDLDFKQLNVYAQPDYFLRVVHSGIENGKLIRSCDWTNIGPEKK